MPWPRVEKFSGWKLGRLGLAVGSVSWKGLACWKLGSVDGFLLF